LSDIKIIFLSLRNKEKFENQISDVQYRAFIGN
jgi:hypothetical protein